MSLAVVVGCAAWCLPRCLMAQELGHKIPGAVGMSAGNQPEVGLYVADRFLYMTANRAFDRAGNPLPIQSLDIDAVANAAGLSFVVKLPGQGPYLSAAFAMPASHVSVSSTRPEVSVDRYGFGDIYVQPVRVGWRSPFVDVVSSYAFYAPTGWFEPGTNRGVGGGQWTHEFSAGGTVGFDSHRTIFVSIPSRSRAASASDCFDWSIWAWRSTHCGRCATIAAPTCLLRFVALAIRCTAPARRSMC